MEQRDWEARRAAHVARVAPWIADRLRRRSRGVTDPTDDFLFDYYPYSPNRLATWHPGYGVVLEGDADAFLAHPAYVRTVDGVTSTLDWLDKQRSDRLDLAIRILQGTAGRPPLTGCFGLHEWAMVYGLEQQQVRHSSLPLRLTPTEIRHTVDAIGLRCTHIDVFRFFTAEAVPLNTLEPTRATQPDLEQPGCLHASMDMKTRQKHNLERPLDAGASRRRRRAARMTRCDRAGPGFRKVADRSRPLGASAAHRATPLAQGRWRR